MSRKLRGLFLNTEKDVCSIYESGAMCFSALSESEEYSLDYCELSVKSRTISLGYDFYLFNYHYVQMGWLDTKAIKKLPGFKATIVLEMSQNSPFDCVSKDDFDAYVVLDPTCRHFLKNVYGFPRPLEAGRDRGATNLTNEVPIIGTFGLSYSDKGFDEVVRAVNREFDAAIVRINVPESKNSSKQNMLQFEAKLSHIKLKENITVELSSHYFSKEELIDWCAENTLNAFLYNRRIGNGLSATTDQAIASGRPLAISTNPTFRHIHSYIKPYPYLSLKEAIETTTPVVKTIRENWSKGQFAVHFQDVLADNNVQPRQPNNFSTAQLPVVGGFLQATRKIFTRQGLILFIPPILLKIRMKILTSLGLKKARDGHVPSVQPFVHQSLHSNSQFQEDLLIDFLLGRKSAGTYVDIGANDPFFNSNTLRFYSRGWTGINIEPGEAEYNRIRKYRERDINLNIAISNEAGSFTLYRVGNDSSLSTLDYSTAIKMAETYKLEIKTSTVVVAPLSEVLEMYLGGRQIDFMSVDAEGHDLEVLASNDWGKYRPSLVMVECNTNFRDISLFMERNDYLYIFSNHVNAIFIDKMSKDKSLLENISWSS